MNHISIFRTGKLWEIDMVRDTMKQANIPHFVREENMSGLKTAFPAAPSPGIGIIWCLMVPESVVEEAKKILSELPIEADKKPSYWDFTSDAGSVKKYKYFIWITLIMIAIIWIFAIFSMLL